MYSVLSNQWVNRLYVSEEKSDDKIEESFLKDVHLFTFNYAGCNQYRNLRTALLQHIDQLIYVVNQRSYSHLSAEVCGGEARTTQLAVRHKYKVGSNF